MIFVCSFKRIELRLISWIFIIEEVISILCKTSLIYITSKDFQDMNKFRYENMSNLKKKIVL